MSCKLLRDSAINTALQIGPHERSPGGKAHQSNFKASAINQIKLVTFQLCMKQEQVEANVLVLGRSTFDILLTAAKAL